jgi:hypothetical protein
MSHRLVKILSYDDGEKANRRGWCWIVNNDGTDRTLCDGVAFGFGDSGCEYKQRVVERGGITCKTCLKLIKEFKAIAL